jgi:putative MATE family efflux protein
LVSKENAKGNQEGLQDAVCQALFIGCIMALIGTPLIFLNPEKVLSVVLKDGAPALEYAKPYLLIRSFAFLPSLISLIGFSAFRGILDTVTPVKISLFANLLNLIMDPLLIFSAALGVPGAAMATLSAELISAIAYLSILRRKNMIRMRKIFKLPAWEKLEPLLKGGLALQLRNFALNLTFLAVTRVTQSIDDTGVAAAAHALSIQTFQIGGIVLLALSVVAQTVVPNEMVEKYDPETKRTSGGPVAAKAIVNRLMSWGLILGSVLGILQLLILPLLHQSTPLQEVREAARLPSILASIYQAINGLVFIGEGVMVGCGNFMQLSLSTVFATAGCLWALNVFPQKYGLTGVWIGFGVFNSMRLLGVWLHYSRNGPLATRNMNKNKIEAKAQ